jgi:hypothetical protein
MRAATISHVIALWHSQRPGRRSRGLRLKLARNDKDLTNYAKTFSESPGYPGGAVWMAGSCRLIGQNSSNSTSRIT